MQPLELSSFHPWRCRWRVLAWSLGVLMRVLALGGLGITGMIGGRSRYTGACDGCKSCGCCNSSAKTGVWSRRDAFPGATWRESSRLSRLHAPRLAVCNHCKQVMQPKIRNIFCARRGSVAREQHAVFGG